MFSVFSRSQGMARVRLTRPVTWQVKLFSFDWRKLMTVHSTCEVL